jgi:cell division protease FtsH
LSMMALVLKWGRVAEEIVFGDISTGAQNDLERSSELVRNMVCTYGMSEKLGALTFGKKHDSLFMGTEYGEEKNYSEETARQIDAEVKQVIQESYQRVKALLEENRPTLDALAAQLEEKEVLSGKEVAGIVEDKT